MTIYCNLDEGEKITNFRVAEAVINLCNERGWALDSKKIAKMILVQLDETESEEEK